MEEKYRAEIEKKRAESVNRAWKIISVFVVVFQLLMLTLLLIGIFEEGKRKITFCICMLSWFTRHLSASGAVVLL